MTTLTPTRVADLRRKIEAKYGIEDAVHASWVINANDHSQVTGKEHFNPLDAEAELEAIIQDAVKAEMEEIDEG